jgi:hypothetical protein
MYAQRCDYGRAWNGSACAGMWAYIIWSSGNSVKTGFSSATMGAANTLGLAALKNSDGPYGAAQYCATLNEDGHADWYLPSQDELKVLFQNRLAVGLSSTDAYWSSTEYGSDTAWGQYFGNGGQYSYPKFAVGLLVHCVRK